MSNKYDIFISYKRKSVATASDLYYRLTIRGYSTFFDLDELKRDNFNVQLLNHIENVKDIFVILEEGSLDACILEDDSEDVCVLEDGTRERKNWKEDWFCREIAYALEKRKNIIPILLNRYEMPKPDRLPFELKELSYKNSPEFSYSFFEDYLNKLIKNGYITAKPKTENKVTSVFKFYSNIDCEVFKEGKLQGILKGGAEEPFYVPVPRKGNYRFKSVNSVTKKSKVFKEHIDANEEKEVDIEWNREDLCVVLPGGVELDMIWIEPGTFMMGSTEYELGRDRKEETQHRVTLKKGYWLGKYPVVQEQYEAVMGINPSQYNIVGFRSPVENVSWDDAMAFCKKLTDQEQVAGRLPEGYKYTLPTEAQWEYACRAGTTTALNSGKNLSDKYECPEMDEVGWYKYNSDERTHPVGRKKPNTWGLYDMHGNVNEWCLDCFDEEVLTVYSEDVIKDPLCEIGSFRIVRGGCWSDDASSCLSASRGWFSPTFLDFPYFSIGFRVALTTSQKTHLF